jgi:hypothetical protein
MLKRIATLLFAVLAIAAVAVPASSATPASPGREHLEMDLEIFDLNSATACGKDVFANVSFASDTWLQRDRTGAVVAMNELVRGKITWFTRGTGKSYSSSIDALVHYDFPEGVDFFKPAKITVVGRNGGTFPIGEGSPPGTGVLHYNGFIYTVVDDDRPYVATDGPAVWKLGDFTSTTKRICAALA